MKEFGVTLFGKIDEQQTIKEVDKTLKEVSKKVDKLELNIDLKRAINDNKQLGDLQSKNIREQIKLNTQLSTSVNDFNQQQYKNLQGLINSREKLINLMAQESTKAEANVEVLQGYQKGLDNISRKIATIKTQISSNNKTTTFQQSNTKAVESGINWSSNQEVKVVNELITLENKLANSRKLSRSAEAQALQSTLTKQKENIRLYQEEIKANGTNTKKALEYKKTIEQTDIALKTQKTSLKVLENQGLNAWEKLTEKAQAYFNYAIAAVTLQKASQAVQEMVNNVMELDASLVELRKVTDLEGASLDAFVDKAYIAARNVAKTGKDMIEAATEFAKSGYNPNMALELGEIALMYGNIADEEVSAGEAANFIIAQMKAFNIEADNAMHIIDAVNEVSNNFAVSSADIANNLGKASSVMANAGNSMEEYIAMMTAITEVTRSADKAANGKKIKPYIYRNMYINIVPNPVIPKAYDNYNIRMKYA